MGGQGSGRLPDPAKQFRQPIAEPRAPISNEMFLPNHSGDHSAGRVRTNPTTPYEIVNKEYVDLQATKSVVQLFLTEDTSADVASYFDLDSTPDTGAEQEITKAINGSTTAEHSAYVSVLSNAVVSAIELIEAGIYTCHVHASSTANKNTFLCCEFYKRASGGGETLIGTTELIELSTSEASVDMHLQITADTAWLATDRFVVKALVRNDNASSKTISIFVKDDNYSGVSFPAFISPTFDSTTVSDTSTINLTLTGVDISGVTIDGAINHDALLNFLAAEHVDWAASTAGTIHITNFAALQNVVEDATPELGGEMDAGAHTIGFTQQSATGDGTTTIDWKLGNKFFFTMGAFNETFTFTAPTNPCSLVLVVKQDSVGSRTATWPATVKWPGGTAPTLTTGANLIDIIGLYFDGTNYYSVASLDLK